MGRLSVGWVVAVALVGCDPPPPVVARSPGEACRLVVDRENACSEEPEVMPEWFRAEQIRVCDEEGDRTVEDDRAALKCVELPDCEAFADCMAQAGRRQGARNRKIAVLQALRGQRDVDLTLETCGMAELRSDAELVALCGELWSKTLAAETEELSRLRDAGGPVEGEERCTKARWRADQMSPEAEREIEVLCEEIVAARIVARALRGVEATLAGDAAELPDACDEAERGLARLTSTWAVQTRERLARACYVELGQRLLPRLVPKSKRCEGPVEQIYAGVKRHRLAAPGIDRWIAQAERVCAGATTPRK